MEGRGLARPPLGLLETLRPWHGAGLLHVLLPEGQGTASGDAPGGGAATQTVSDSASGADAADMRAFLPACDAPRHMQGEQRPARAAATAYDGNDGDPSFDPDAYDIPPDPADSSDAHYDATMGMGRAPAHVQTYRQQAAPRPGPPAGGMPRPAQGAHPSPPTGLADAPPPVASGPAASIVPPERWPAAWRELFTKTPQPAPVLWTYWALGLDLSGCADAARRDTLRRILGALQQPKGSNAFWPVAMPDAEASLPRDVGSSPNALPVAPDVVADTALFLAGLERIAPRLVVVMGSKALRAFAPDLRARPYQQIPWRGRLLIVLPDMDNLIAAPATVEAVIAYLRTALKPASR